MNPLLSDAAIAAAHHPDPHIRDTIALAIQALEAVPQHLLAWQAELAHEQTLADCLHIAPGQMANYRQLASHLCDNGEFLLALPLAMVCAAYVSDDPEHSFLAGACLQRLGDPASASHFYRVALQLNTADAASAYRLAECLESIGQSEAAAHLYQWTIELGRGNFALRTLQDMAGRRLARLEAIRFG
jgi:tetratricopeptide (TPR) repeat protein